MLSTEQLPSPAASVTEDGLLTKRTIAPKLEIKPRTLDEWMRQGRIPYIKIGKSVRFRWADVVAKLNGYRMN